jgi:hypothetical protein
MSETKTKMTVRIDRDELEWFRSDLKNLPFGQDGLLDLLIAAETPALADDLKGLWLSSVAKRYIAGELKRREPKLVSIYVRRSTQAALKKVTDATNVPRDAFINRLLMFWRGSPALLKWLEVPEYVEQIDQPRNEIVFRLETSPRAAIRNLLQSPFLFLREARLTANPEAEGLYRLLLRDPYHAFNCYMEDWRVPNSRASKEMDKALDAGLQALAREEREVFARPHSGGAQ